MKRSRKSGSGTARDESQDILAKIVALLNAGAAQKAETMLRVLIDAEPQNHRALDLMAQVAQQSHRLDEAIEFIKRAIEVAPSVPGYRDRANDLLRAADRHPEAVAEIQHAIALNPDNTHYINKLGITYCEMNALDSAAETYQSALAVNPDIPEFRNNLGNIFRQQGHLDAALEQFDRALQLDDANADAHSNKGFAILEQKSIDLATAKGALTHLERAVALGADKPALWRAIGLIRHDHNDHEEAVAALERYMQSNPHDPKSLVTIAAAYTELGKIPTAAACLRHLLDRKPDDFLGLRCLGQVTMRLGNNTEAQLLLKQALALDPDDPEALFLYAQTLLHKLRLDEAKQILLRLHTLAPDWKRPFFAYSFIQLMEGDFENGLEGYQSRLDLPTFSLNLGGAERGVWDGSPLNGRTLLVHVEQGYGDAFQFCRYIPMIRDRLGTGGKVIVLVKKPTLRMLSQVPGIDEIHSHGKPGTRIESHLNIPLLSLPYLFGTRLETIPNQIPYLHVPEEAKRTEPLPGIPGSRLKVGIVWAGSATHMNDKYRSIPIDVMARLFDMEDIEFHSLQIGEEAAAFTPWLERDNCFEHTTEISDFADTAAIIDKLDLVVTVDTALCHLAGAMGKEVWTLIARGGEWRWLVGREDSPWYPTMRIFRQPILGNWEIVIDRVRKELKVRLQSL